MDLQPCRSLHPGRPNHYGTGAAEPEAPRGIASRSTKSISFIDIDRWVFRCAVVMVQPRHQCSTAFLGTGIGLGVGPFALEKLTLVLPSVSSLTLPEKKLIDVDT